MGAKDINTSSLSHLNDQIEQFSGLKIQSEHIKQINLSGQTVAILGVNQAVVSHLNYLTEHCRQVYVFQTSPQLVLPQSSRVISTLIPHPLIAKNRRLFSNRIKRLLALRFLEKEVSNVWLRKLLTANATQPQKQFLKSDSYFQAVQKSNCQLITWPISGIKDSTIYLINGEFFEINTLVLTI